MKPSVIITIVFLDLVAGLHLLRLWFGVAVTVNGTVIPMWPSALAGVALSALSVWLWREQRAQGPVAT